MNTVPAQKPVIVCIDHHENPMDDRAWTHLGELGFERRLVCPFLGDDLGAVGPEVVGCVIYGGSQNVGEIADYPYLRDEFRWIEDCLERDLPILGLCLGGQMLAHILGAKVAPRLPRECEFGCYPLTATEAGAGWIPEVFHATEAHYEEFEIPRDAVHLAGSERFPNQAFRYRDNVYGLQFHPEIDARIFRRWQQAEWAMHGVPGAQEMAEQDRLFALHDEVQGRWFHGLLESLFGRPDA